MTATSLPSTALGDAAENNAASIFRTQDGVAPVEKAAAALENAIEQLKTDRKQERFFWILGTVGLLNTLVDSFVPWNASLILLLFSLVFLIGSAKWLSCQV